MGPDPIAKRPNPIFTASQPKQGNNYSHSAMCKNAPISDAVSAANFDDRLLEINRKTFKNILVV